MKKSEASLTGLSVDVEEWFHAPGYERQALSTYGNTLPATLEDGMERCLALMETIGAKATFFVLGWVAERYPSIPGMITAADHELASHGWDHTPVSSMSRRVFEGDVRRARETLEDRTGLEVKGYRAPAWSMPREEWAYEVLAEAGFAYSSSVLPLPWTGGGPRTPFQVAGVTELPALRFQSRMAPLPAGGTVALRLLPMGALRAAKDHSVERGIPAVYWFHPWELVPRAPRLNGGLFFNLARYIALGALPYRLRALLTPGDLTLRRLALRFPLDACQRSQGR